MEYRRHLEECNYITVLQQEKNLSLQDAADHIGAEFETLLRQFLLDEASLPSWGPSVDAGVQQYVASIKDSIIGYIIWCFDTYRYFGPDDREVRHTLLVKLEAETEKVRRNPCHSAFSRV